MARQANRNARPQIMRTPPVTVRLYRQGDYLCARASVKVGLVELDFIARMPSSLIRSYVAQMMSRASLAGETPEVGFSLKSALKKAGKVVSKAAASAAVAAVLAKRLPVVGPAASAMAQKVTGVALTAAQMAKVADLAKLKAMGSKLAKQTIQGLMQKAIAGNPIAAASLTALRVVSKYVPAVKKVTDVVDQVAPPGPSAPFPGLPGGLPLPFNPASLLGPAAGLFGPAGTPGPLPFGAPGGRPPAINAPGGGFRLPGSLADALPALTAGGGIPLPVLLPGSLKRRAHHAP